jgi:hypothetical protein
MLSNSRFGFSVVALAVLMLATALPAPAQQENRPKRWKDTAEYNLAVSAARDADPTTKLADLDQWSAAFPQSEFSDDRLEMYFSTYQQLNQPRQAFDVAQMILQNHPNNYRALTATVSAVAAILPTSADLDTAESAATYLLANIDAVFEASNRPFGMSGAEWARAKDAIEPFVQQALQTIRGLR